MATFGRRAPLEPSPVLKPVPKPPIAPVSAPSPAIAEKLRPVIEIDRTADEAVARDIENWKALRKAKKRSFREPWRSFAIASSAVFGLSMWLLPDSVATVVEYLTTGLTIVSIAQGFRKR